MYNLFTSVWKTKKPLFYCLMKKLCLSIYIEHMLENIEKYIYFFHHENKKKKVMQAV